MSQPTKKVIFYRESILVESVASKLYEYLNTGDDITILAMPNSCTSLKTSSTTEKISEQSEVICFGGYFLDDAENMSKIASKVTYILNVADNILTEYLSLPNVTFSQSSAPCAWTLAQSNPTKISDISKSGLQLLSHLDGYLTNMSHEDTVIQQGLYARATSPDIILADIVMDIVKADETIASSAFDSLRHDGEIALKNTVRIVTDRVKASKEMMIDGMVVRVAMGDSPIVETARALADLSPHGIGMVYRHNLSADSGTGRTLFSICCIEPKDSINKRQVAGLLASKWINGGGGIVMGGGSVLGLETPEFLTHMFS